MKLQTIFSRFLLTGSTVSKGMAKVAWSWSECCYPKSEGGLGVRVCMTGIKQL